MPHPRHLLLLAAFLSLAPRPARAQDATTRAVGRYVSQHQAGIVRELVDFLSIPNVAGDSVNIRRTAAALKAMMEQRGIRSRLLETGGPPMVYGELAAKGATTTILFYCHYDGQPVDRSRWVGHDPWQPVLRTGRREDPETRVIPVPATGAFDADWRIYARSASDDKSPIVALLWAIDALRAAERPPSVNIKFLFEGDEEAGSAYMREVIARNRELLRSDLVVMVDGPEHASRRPTVIFGARGITSVRLVAYGPSRPLHSGHYGNWAPNPAMELARLLATMKDGGGKVLVDGWYDDVVPLTAEEEAAMRAVPAESAAEFGFAEPEGGPGALRLERIALPSLNVRGLASAWVGDDARTIVPDSAVAELDLRLVPSVEPDRQVERLVAHIRKQGWHVVSESPDAETRAGHARIVRVDARESGYPGMRTRFDHPVARRVVEALRRGSPEPPVIMPIMGGSVPAVWFPVVAGTDVLLLPIVNHDNNQHAPNENVRLGNVFRGIETLAAVMRLAPEAAKAARGATTSGGRMGRSWRRRS